MTPEDTADGERDGGGTSLSRRVGVALVSLLLLVSVVTAVGIYAVQGTALNAQYVTDTMDAEGAYGELEAMAEDMVVNQTVGSLGDATDVVPDAEATVEETVRETITRSYVQQEVDRNLERTYAYLHGESDRLNLTVDTRPVLDNVSGAVTRDIEAVSTADLFRQTGIEASFAQSSLGFSRVSDAVEDEQTYREVQSEMRSNTQRLGLTSNDINASLRGDLTPPPAVEDPVYRMQGLIVLAMTTDMPYAEFQTRLDRAHSQFASAAGEYAEQQVRQEVPAMIDLNEGLDGGGRQQIDRVADAVQLTDTLALAVPLFALALVAVLLGLTHSISSTARVLGTTLATAGVAGAITGFVGGTVVVNWVREALANAQEFLVSILLAVLEGLLGTLTTYGIVLLIAGAILVGVSVALRRYRPEQIPAEWR